MDLQTNTPVLLLQETDGEGRTLPIFIGNPEATAIAYAIQGVAMPRPLTHDLMKNVLGALEIKVEQVIIPLLRQRNPESRQRAVEAADELGALGQTMRATLMRAALRRHVGG